MNGDETLSAQECRRRALLGELAVLSDKQIRSGQRAGFQLLYWRGILRRVAGQSEAVAQPLMDKAEAAITALRTVQSNTGADRGCPPASVAARSRLEARTRQRLAQLNSILSHRPAILHDGSSKARLHSSFAEQDRLLWAAMARSPIEVQPETRRSTTDTGASGERLVLRAARDLGATRARFQLDQLLATALADQPEFPGPLNPQRLLVRLLMRLHDTSPAYLVRTLDHSRTLLGLQQGGKKGSPPRAERKPIKTRSSD